MAAPVASAAPPKVEAAAAAGASAPPAAAADAKDSKLAVSDSKLENRIKEILKTADLDKLTPKLCRKQLEIEFACDLTARKDFINAVLNAGLAPPPPVPALQYAASNESDSKSNGKSKKGGAGAGAGANKPEPVKVAKTQEELDAELARELAGGNRPRRGAAASSYQKADKRREKAEAKAAAPPKEKKKRPPKLVQLSPQLGTFMGVDRATRGDVTKKIWAHVNEHKLKDPKDGRNIILDDKLKTIFGDKRKSVNMFKMTKFLSTHMKKPEDLVNGGQSEEEEEDEDGGGGGDD